MAEVVYKQQCDRLLSCGRRCRQLCPEQCVCLEEVNKPLSCGHHKLMKCRDESTLEVCEAMVEHTFPDCQHKVMLKCGEDVSQCPSTCGKPLPGCDHPCPANCGECYRGRLHVPCKQSCKTLLICGHECAQPCNGNEMCPPCQQPCESSCMHGACNSLDTKIVRCGEDCYLCCEPCPSICEHRICSKRCGMLCDVEPCNEPCKKIKKCGHQCMGLCGETCLDICRICGGPHWDEASSIFFGQEDNEEARFIKFIDCGHIIEVNHAKITSQLAHSCLCSRASCS